MISILYVLPGVLEAHLSGDGIVMLATKLCSDVTPNLKVLRHLARDAELDLAERTWRTGWNKVVVHVKLSSITI
ncbi:hypothetical protein WJT86_11700 [Microvirga sp. W0021]|uniref:Uncharacterized protein n=1 Tax=Hohaiivirga grylli TaxID=3133970 RepID=A0ABV0BLC3_9HYPH